MTASAVVLFTPCSTVALSTLGVRAVGNKYHTLKLVGCDGESVQDLLRVGRNFYTVCRYGSAKYIRGQEKEGREGGGVALELHVFCK